MAMGKTYSIHDTMLGVSVDSESESRPLFHAMNAMLRRRGVTVHKDPKIDRDYKCLSPTHRAGNWGELKFKSEYFPVGMRIEFYQSLVTENPHGGEHDFDKLKKMPFLIRMRFQWVVNQIVQFLEGNGFVRNQKFYDWHADPLRTFNESWESHRFSRGPDGWPDDECLSSWPRGMFDKDGVKIRSGEDRYVNVDGRFMRCTVYGGINGMWHAIAPGIHRQVGSWEVYSKFPGRGRLFEQEDRKKRINRALDLAVKTQRFLRAHAISQQLRK